MKLSRSIPLALAGVFAAGALMVAAPTAAHDDDDHKAPHGHAHDPTDVWTIARGGQIYDNWMAVMEADKPKNTHPAYPAAGKKKGAATWRCKECHGWDYMGKDGAYAKGSHFSGIKGVRGVAGMAPEKIHKIIMNKTHGYSTAQMPHAAMEKVALFLSKGQIDLDRYVDRKTKKAHGNPRKGAATFQTVCAVCHGFDGKDINFKEPPKAEYVGTVCAKNPWEALHKIRFGQPGVGMVALSSLDMDVLVKILSYCQTLPTK